MVTEQFSSAFALFVLNSLLLFNQLKANFQHKIKYTLNFIYRWDAQVCYMSLMLKNEQMFKILSRLDKMGTYF